MGEITSIGCLCYLLYTYSTRDCRYLISKIANYTFLSWKQMKHLHKYKHGFLDKWLLIQLGKILICIQQNCIQSFVRALHTSPVPAYPLSSGSLFYQALLQCWVHASRELQSSRSLFLVFPQVSWISWWFETPWFLYCIQVAKYYCFASVEMLSLFSVIDLSDFNLGVWGCVGTADLEL